MAHQVFCAPSEMRAAGVHVDPSVVAGVHGVSDTAVNPLADDGAVGEVPPIREQLHHRGPLRGTCVLPVGKTLAVVRSVTVPQQLSEPTPWQFEHCSKTT